MIAVAVLGKRSRSWPGNVPRSVQCDGSVLPRSPVHYAPLSHRIDIENTQPRRVQDLTIRCRIEGGHVSLAPDV